MTQLPPTTAVAPIAPVTTGVPQNLFDGMRLKVTPGGVMGVLGIALLGPKWMRMFNDVTTQGNRMGGPEGIIEKAADWLHFGVLTAAIVGLNSQQGRRLMCQVSDAVLGKGIA